jgi:hypothetical protein
MHHDVEKGDRDHAAIAEQDPMAEQRNGAPLKIDLDLTESEVKGLNAGIKEFDLKSPVLDLPLLPDELIETRFSNLARTVRGGISSMVIAGRGAVQGDLESNGLAMFRRS